MHINPDHFLETTTGRVITPERNRQAWARSFAALDEALSCASPATRAYVMIGPQGSGKSTWVRAQKAADAIFFDAILVKREERQPVLAAAKAASVPVVAVWFNAPLSVCLLRNAMRPQDEVVPEQAIRNVHAALEPPSLDEGFCQVLEVVPGADAGEP